MHDNQPLPVYSSLRNVLRAMRSAWWFARNRCMGCGERNCTVGLCRGCYYSPKFVSARDEGVNADRYYRGQRTFVYCPHCRFELVSGGNFVYDNERGVYYRCRNCHRASMWNFDIAPCPIYVVAA